MKGSSGITKLIRLYVKDQHYLKKALMKLCPRLLTRILFYRTMGYWPDIDHPKTFNEKIQWFKFYVRDSRITRCADKLAVREYVAEKVGGAYLIPLIGVYDSVDEIDLAVLPDKFVLKPNHSSGKVLICRDKRKINWIKAADIMRNWLRENYYDLTGEWGYKDIPPKIMCEKLLQGEIIDYKFFCFVGIPIIANVIGDRKEGGYHEIWVDLDFESLLLTQNSRGFSSRITKPEHWEKMIQIAQILSKEFPFVRVDLYDLGGQVYFGELTFTPANGMDEGLSLAIDRDLGKRYDTLRWDIKK